ncbi:membrane dipeptidase-domain-containing protein [Sporodiniella umbellata]|nr:membrane dipeptidase-domain-containing protein [Sporodiniella umbellata]
MTSAQNSQGPTTLVDSDQHIYRNIQSKDELITCPIRPKLNEEERLIGNLWKKTVEADENKRVFGGRALIKIHTNEVPSKDGDKKPKKWSFFELEDYKWLSRKEANKKVQTVASAFQKAGLEKGDIVLLYCKTRLEWMITAIGALTVGLIITTAYDAMPADSITHIIKESEAKAIFTETSLLGTLNKAYEELEKTEQPKFVIYTGEEFEAPDEVQAFKSQKADDVNIVHFRDLEEVEEVKIKESPSPKDLALIMYTSGSTGAPKGVELTHANIIAAIGAAERNVSTFMSEESDVYIGYLPLAHVLEFLIEFTLIIFGVPIGYGTARTLMNDSVSGPNGEGKGEGDLKCLKPTLMAGVPAVWEKIRKGVEDKLKKQNWVVRQAFYAAIEAKWQLLKLLGGPNALTATYDSVLFSQIGDVTGGKLRFGLSGGAPVSLETQKFINSTLCFLLQGYGLTECCGLAAMTIPELGLLTGAIGPPSASIEFRLVDVPDTDHKAENNEGELWLRGPSLMRGYYKRPDITEEALTSDGWFKTGDIAQLNSDGSFAITDRLKNLVKLAHGEYIALENVESKYRNSSSIKNICLVADSNKSYIVGVVEPSDDNADKDSLLKELQQTAKSSGCNRVEIVKDIVVTRKIDWSKDLMTTSGKMKRKDQVMTVGKDKKEPINRVHKILQNHPLIDTHNDLPMSLAFTFEGKINSLNLTHLNWGHTDIERLRKGQLAGQFWSIYYDCDDTSSNQVLRALESIDVTKRMIKLYPETFQLATSTKEFKKAFKKGRVASMMGIEGGQMIDSSMAALRQFYDLGVRYMTLTHNCHTPWAESCCDPEPAPFNGLGLTKFGEKIILEMNRLGMMVDISHVAHSTMHAVLNVTQAPVLFSHSSSHAICSIERNVPDSVLRRLDEVDGVVMVNFYNNFVQCDRSKEATLIDVANHVEYIASVAGRDRVGLGADYNGIEATPIGLEDVSKYPELLSELASRGWTDNELIALAGGNLLRVWEKVEKIRTQLAKRKQLPHEDRLADFN